MAYKLYEWRIQLSVFNMWLIQKLNCAQNINYLQEFKHIKVHQINYLAIVTYILTEMHGIIKGHLNS